MLKRSLVFSLFLAFAIVSVSGAYAAGVPLSIQQAAYVSGQSDYKLNVSIGGGSDACSGSVTIGYDSACLKLVSIYKGSILSDATFLANTALGDGVAKFTWISLTPLKDSGMIAALSFKLTAGRSAAVELISAGLSDINSENIGVTLTNGGVSSPDESSSAPSAQQNAMSNFILDTKRYTTIGKFSDVDDSAWYGANKEASVKQGVELGLLDGYGNGAFGPNDQLKIGHALKLAAIIYSIYSGDCQQFNQAEGGHWYDCYAAYAIAKGIIKPGDFTDYAAVCTRTEMAYIFAYSLPSSEFKAINRVASLPDVTETDTYGTEILLLYRAGILAGNDNAGTFGGSGSFTRAEAAAVCTRICLPSQRISVSN